MFTRVIQRKRPRRPLFMFMAVAAVTSLLFAAVALAIVNDSGTVDVQVTDKFSSKVDQPTAQGAFISYFGDGDTTFGSSGTGTFDPFVRLQGSPNEDGYNTNGKVEFETKKGTWTKAKLVSEIPQRPCPGPEDPPGAPPPPVLGSLTCFELFVDINEGNNSKHVSLNDVEIYFATGPGAATLVGYDFGSPPTGTTVTKEYDFNGNILINDVNQGSGRGDLRYNVQIGAGANQVPLPANCNYGNPACTTYFVLYSQWGTSSLAAPPGDTWNSDGGFEEWKVRIYPTPPDIQVVKTPDATTTITAGTDAVFTIVVTNNGPIAATNVTLTDTLPNSGLSWTVGGADAAACSITTGVLTCNFGTIGFPTANTRTITLTSATDAADCTRGGTGNIDNTALVSATNEDPGASGNNSDSGQITVSCAAIKIVKQSTKSGNPLVSTEGAVFSISGPGGYTNSVTDDNAADVEDKDLTIGEVCIDGLAPGDYTVIETSPPLGYAASTDTDGVVVTATQGTSCASTTIGTATFTNAPLGEIGVTFTDLGSGETNSSIVCAQGATTIPADDENGGADSSTITGNSAANPTVVTTSADHGLTSGATVQITGSTSDPSIDGTWTVTVLSDTTFSIPIEVTVAGSTGTVTAMDDTDETYTDLAPGTYNCQIVIDP